MAIGGAMYQFILNYHLTTHNLITTMLARIVHILQVSILCYDPTLYMTCVCICHYICMVHIERFIHYI